MPVLGTTDFRDLTDAHKAKSHFFRPLFDGNIHLKQICVEVSHASLIWLSGTSFECRSRHYF